MIIFITLDAISHQNNIVYPRPILYYIRLKFHSIFLFNTKLTKVQKETGYYKVRKGSPMKIVPLKEKYSYML